MDKPKEFWIFPQKGNDCEWTNLYPDNSWKSETKPLIHVREVGPCPNCDRLEDQLYHESRKAPEIEYKLGHEIEVLQAKLDKACEALEFYAEPDEWDTNKISTIDVEDTNIDGVSTNTPWGYTILKGGKRAREALQEIRKNDEK